MFHANKARLLPLGSSLMWQKECGFHRQRAGCIKGGPTMNAACLANEFAAVCVSARLCHYTAIGDKRN